MFYREFHNKVPPSVKNRQIFKLVIMVNHYDFFKEWCLMHLILKNLPVSFCLFKIIDQNV